MTGKEQGGIPFATDFLQERDGLGGVLGVQRGRGLVREDHVRIRDQRPSDRHPLLLANAESIYASGGIGDPKPSE